MYENEFYDFILSESVPSSWITWPTPKNPSSLYKYVSMEFNMSIDQMNWTRQTYSALDWFSDLGGLIDMLIFIIRSAVAPMASYSLHSALVSTYFRF